MLKQISRVVRKEIVAYGTHSHSKTKLFVRGLFSKGEKSFNLNHHDNVETVDITRKEGNVIAKLPDKLQIMDNVSYETLDASAPEELYNELNEGDQVIFIDFKGNIQIIEKK